MKRGGGGDEHGGAGEIIEVQGGQIIKATGRKDRHSKVYTSKGPRDRRVRLSAHTAIQFYDVQDRLGYDRPSKAVDWLITKARTAIDNLAQPPSHHTTALAPPGSDTSNPGSSEPSNSHVYQSAQQSIADTMRSFFPVSPEDSSSSLMNMQGFGDGRMSRQHQGPLSIGDLGLSLHSSQQQTMNHMVFPGSNNHEMFESSYHKSSDDDHPSWSATGEGESMNNGRVNGFIFNQQSLPHQQLYLSQNSSISSSAFSQREPLQSNSFSNLVNLNHHASWNNNASSMDHHHHHQATHQPYNQQAAFYNIHFGSGFQLPARIRGEENPGGLNIDNKHN